VNNPFKPPDQLALARRIIARLESASGPLGVRQWDIATALDDAHKLLQLLESQSRPPADPASSSE
jgi:hypothetical protein